eukprot:gene2546-3277_t
MRETLDAVNAALAAKAWDRTTEELRAFVDSNDDPRTSPNLRSDSRDDCGPLIAWLTGGGAQRGGVEAAALGVRALKALTRKQCNYSSLPQDRVAAVAAYLASSGCEDAIVCRDGCYVVLNLCYKPAHVPHLVPAIPMLIGSLAGDPDLRTAAASALQGLCQFPMTKQAVTEQDGGGALIRALDPHHHQSAARVLGALRNLTSHVPAAVQVRSAEGIPVILSCMRDAPAAVTRPAAGLVQNMLRDKDSVVAMRSAGASEVLLPVVCSSDVSSQVSAVGALLNLLPDPDVPSDGPDRRKRYCSMLGSLLALSMLADSFGSASYTSDSLPSLLSDLDLDADWGAPTAQESQSTEGL